MSSAGGEHPKVLGFVIDNETALELEVKELISSMDAVVGAVFRDIEKLKALGIDYSHDYDMDLKQFKGVREYRKSDEFKEKVRQALGT